MNNNRTAIENRIALLETRDKENKAIIAKLRRKLAKMDAEKSAN